MELEEQMAETIEAVMAILTTYGLSVIGAIVTLIVGWIVACWVAGTIRRASAKSEKIDTTLGSFFASMAKYAILAFTFIAVLSRFGVETTSFVAVMGALGLAIGLSLQNTLSNVASGVMLIMFRPFKVGDFVDTAGVSGTVKAITLFTTEMSTGDNVKVIVPNGAIWGGTIKNFSGNTTRRVDLLMGIGYGSNIDHAIKTMTEIVNADSRVHGDPEPFFAVGELADSSVNIIVRVWTNAPDYWGVKFDLTKAFKEAFDREGIDIPFPQTVVHHVNDQS
ncbi:MAG: mechanosensitive ion channel family protein [Rhodospirillaceae bacterium]|jgi:small conductance mechanosensitive channel